MAEYAELTKRERKKRLLYAVCFTLIAWVSVPLLVTQYWYAWVAILVVGMSLLTYVTGKEEPKRVYKCPKCSHEFTLSFFTSAFAWRGVIKKDGKWYEWKYVKCPLCHDRSMMVPLSEGGPASSQAEWQ